MSENELNGPVVVGIDGSRAALFAAELAVDEAISRDVPLCLVHVARTAVTARSFVDECRNDGQYAETVLRSAAAAIEGLGKPVKIDSVVLRGLPAEALIVESRSASLVCVGTGRFAAAVLGSTATELAEHAHCPVLVAQRPDADSSSELATLENTAAGRSWNNLSQRWIALSINGTDDNHRVTNYAMREAHLRQLPVLAISPWSHNLTDGMRHELDRRIACLREQYRDVHVYPVTTRSRICRFIARCQEPIALTVIGASEWNQTARICASSGGSGSSVLVVRHR